ncbi:hypothetical protein [Saliniramus fredricksonii]|uniref:hypothetical protein n=1 Tax=Saliniramus fredricksonii TaxID=1653334 RepID=UPI0013F4DA97|nr:hypothetical protein [Saliniramus fredricksonii]
MTSLAREVGLDDIGLDSLAVVDLLFELAARYDADLETALEVLIRHARSAISPPLPGH